MDRYRATVVTTALVVALAGCSLPSDAPTDTVTPVDIGSTDPPGVSTRTDSVDAEALLDAHERALANRSFALRVNRTERQHGETVGTLGVDAGFGAADGEYRMDVRASGRLTAYAWAQRSRYWAGDGQSVVVREYNQTTLYHQTEPARWALPIESTRRSRIAGALADLTVTSIEPQASGVRIEARADPAGDGVTDFWSAPTVRSATLVLDVSNAGLIRAIDLEYTLVESDGDRIQIRETTQIDGVGSTTVGRPAWVETALPNASSATPDRDRPGY
ncbi:DUF7537 family lipoprotein [Halococcoides cellulosivorans]|uniref:Lipoprotein n=1 Tax=Halococcoides cellulosivorans TaxID=1679096 RepID=A0A2R4X2J5_9EURY|nr:hypothetical protein [Halococcoides cellulosivorans]AWB27994.1 hypothetical protein HARCEL1_09880 [Halococcoides cellulosivorans]